MSNWHDQRSTTSAFGLRRGVVPLHGIIKAWRVWLVAHVEEGGKRDVLLQAVNRLAKRSRIATKKKLRSKTQRRGRQPEKS